MKKITIPRIIGTILNIILLILNFKPWIDLQGAILTFTKWNKFKHSIEYYSGSRDWGMYDLLAALAWIIVLCIVVSIINEICGESPDAVVPIMSFFILVGEIILILVGKTLTKAIDEYMWWSESTITGAFWVALIIAIFLLFSVPERIGKAIGNSITIDAATITNKTKDIFEETKNRLSESGAHSKTISPANKEETVLLKDMYYNEAPLVIKKAALVKVNSEYYAELIFKNISNKMINAVQINIEGTDPFGTITDTIDNYAYLDLAVNKSESFGENTLIPLPSGKSRNISITINGVLFDDKKMWERQGEPLIQYTPEEGTFN